MLEWPQPMPHHDAMGEEIFVGNDEFIGASAGSSGRLDAEALLVRALVQEVHTAALITAAAASAVNLARTARGPIALSEARTLIVEFPARIDDWPRRILDEQLSNSVIEDISGFYALFSDARSRMLNFEREAISIGLDRAGTLHLGSLTTAWRLTSRHALYAAESVTSESEPLLPPSYAGNMVMLDGLLKDAIAGRATLCDASGAIHLPQLAERRRTPRRSLLQSAHVRIGNNSVVAFVKDVSIGGLGLTRMPEAAEGEAVLVELSCGRVLRGRIAWSRGESAGLRFERHLRPTDPLLFG